MKFEEYLTPAIAKTTLGFPVESKLIFVVGGSQGAEAINRHLEDNYSWYKNRKNTSLLWQCGENNLKQYQHYSTWDSQIQVLGFIYKIPVAYSAADIIVARAGALTLSELAIVGKPSILIPLPTAAANHQYYNAVSYAKTGAAIVIEQKDLDTGILETTIDDLLNDPDRLREMSECAKKSAKPDATENIVQSIYWLASRGKN